MTNATAIETTADSSIADIGSTPARVQSSALPYPPIMQKAAWPTASWRAYPMSRMKPTVATAITPTTMPTPTR